jgi:hypothetical protein
VEQKVDICKNRITDKSKLAELEPALESYSGLSVVKDLFIKYFGYSDYQAGLLLQAAYKSKSKAKAKIMDHVKKWLCKNNLNGMYIRCIAHYTITVDTTVSTSIY